MQQKINTAVIKLMAIWSLQIFAHIMAAMLPWYVQNFVVITLWKFRWQQNKISKEFRTMI